MDRAAGTTCVCTRETRDETGSEGWCACKQEECGQGVKEVKNKEKPKWPAAARPAPRASAKRIGGGRLGPEAARDGRRWRGGAWWLLGRWAQVAVMASCCTATLATAAGTACHGERESEPAPHSAKQWADPTTVHAPRRARAGQRLSARDEEKEEEGEGTARQRTRETKFLRASMQHTEFFFQGLVSSALSLPLWSTILDGRCASGEEEE